MASKDLKDYKDLKHSKGYKGDRSKVLEEQVYAKDLIEKAIKREIISTSSLQDDKLAQLKEKYGPFMVIMVDCFDQDSKGNCIPKQVGRLSPIEMALIPPFNLQLKEAKVSDIRSKILEPLLIPADIDQEVMLVAYMKSPDALGLRSNYLVAHNPVVWLLEAMIIPDSSGKTFRIFKQSVENIRSAYIDSVREFQRIIYNEDYANTDEQYKGVRAEILNDIIAMTKDTPIKERYDLFNKYIAITSSFKSIPPKPIESIIDYYAANIILKDSSINSYSTIVHELYKLPTLVEYFKQIATNSKTGINWAGEDLLKYESFRVAQNPDAVIDKNYFTISNLREKSNLLRIRGYDYKFIDKFLNEFTPLYKDFDYTKTRLTGSAMAFLIQSFNSRDEVKLYPSITVIPEIKDPRFYTLDLSRKVVLGPNKQVEAIFDFGADIDLSVDTNDSKEFDLIAQKHYDIVLKKYPNSKFIRNERTNGYTYTIVSTDLNDYINKGFRVVEIYRGNITKILSHHVPMVRGWYDGQVYYDITAYMVHHGEYDNYYYFASSKSKPLDIILKYYKRGFTLKINFPKVDDNKSLVYNTGGNRGFRKIFDLMMQTAEEIHRQDIDFRLQLNNLTVIPRPQGPQGPQGRREADLVNGLAYF